MTDGIEKEDHVDRLQRQWARELPDLDTQPMTILGRAYRLSNLVRPSIEATFADFGLDRGEFDVIATLRRSGPPYRLTPTDMYSALMISSGGLTHRLDRLEKAGLIRRERSPHDGRSVLVALTEAGAALAEKAIRTDMASEASFLQGLDARERETLAALLRKLIGGIERELTPSGEEIQTAD
ncbi:DNA-binding MarR family transcriptional regulator [Rhizobium pisi]|uniref:MarR family transcriptional regulator n=1 Tax=Rhizobium pisi TaxID=574561 RepID=A0A3R9HL72_9HYPH|nr:MarR family transcriptional regulator [Rhizobium pisi]MBB3133321.1 DNA-binding MarR family transcriptional regulator [Rhizobium pisi]RSB82390.1 MarR family transcriptional regulator [Rhizobium pisi]TCA57754.1 MarR family transcriptional regulator [Rhizobium pisi]